MPVFINFFYLSNQYEVEFGFVIDKKWHNQGFATELGKAQIQYALNVLKCKNVFARAHSKTWLLFM